MAPARPISELASIIERHSRTLENELKDSPISKFSIEFGAPPQVEIPAVLEATRSELIETIDELRIRVLGPLGYLLTLMFPVPALAGVFHVLYKFDIPSNVPISKESISYKDLAERCNIPEDDVRRIIQSAITFRVFEEVEPEVSIRHNAISSTLAIPHLKDMLGLVLEEQLPGTTKLTDSIKLFPGSGEPGHSASVLAFREAKAVKNSGLEKEVVDPSKSFFDCIAEDEERVARFRSAMGMSTKSLAFKSSFFVDSLPWADKSQCPETIVDIGGAGGEIAQAILRGHRNVKKAIVLDLPEVVGDAKVPEDLEGKLEYASYNFLTETVSHPADAYIFRHIFHDWSDQYGTKILKNLVPALKKGGKIWLSEVVLPNLNEMNLSKSQMQRAADIFMKSGFNGKERSRKGWENLLALADERLRIVSVTKPEGAHDSVIEIVFDA
ncbi:S-adenosyl-L-methionine-dependent methyltransferase [Hypoxylon trugodes]|uniref:S-adenosyl-L-methionine-dependent methyltransferase n=1 Tax=Hypoxylon trugodes TaxID=326681 RepID=UPI0021963828|nr:S-adenosyl-L-methionine-dependent methyltransferase [Hypoxylon trugodes]KAI1384763.1 S-adenosyl-L-methionine-dependent methyltransferase [Hypoxylon trugodes]